MRVGSYSFNTGAESFVVRPMLPNNATLDFNNYQRIQSRVSNFRVVLLIMWDYMYFFIDNFILDSLIFLYLDETCVEC